jgi:succinoglycan biosynthesis protein ExoO
MVPIISVVIAARNAAPYVASAIESALRQTVRDIEVIAVDDGSSDGTFAAVATAAQRDRRVVALRMDRHVGAAAARNHAISVARGKWIAILDADDLFRPMRLERLLAVADATEADLIADNLIERDFDSGAELGLCLPEDYMRGNGPLPLVELILRDMPDAPARRKLGYMKPILRRAFLRASALRYRTELRVGEDFLFHFECLAHGGRLHLVPDAYYVLSRRRGSLSMRRDAMFHDHGLANRRALEIARRLRPWDLPLLAALRRRQRLLDAESFALFLEQRHLRDALRVAPAADPKGVLRAIRAASAAVLRDQWRAGSALVPAMMPYAACV